MNNNSDGQIKSNRNDTGTTGKKRFFVDQLQWVALFLAVPYWKKSFFNHPTKKKSKEDV